MISFFLWAVFFSVLILSPSFSAHTSPSSSLAPPSSLSLGPDSVSLIPLFGESFLKENPTWKSTLNREFDELLQISLFLPSRSLENQQTPQNAAETDFFTLLKDHMRLFSEQSAHMEDMEKAEALLIYLHTHFLKNYSVYQSYLPTALEEGIYNCVSSAVLYALFAKNLGFEVRGVETDNKDHVFISILIDGEWIDVETTNSNGFNPGNKKYFHDEFKNVTGFTYMAKYDKRRKNVSLEDLIGLIFQNTSALEAMSKDALSSYRTAQERFFFLPTPSAQEKVQNTLHNLVIWFDQKKDYEQGLSFLSQGRVFYGSDPASQTSFEELANLLVNNGLLRILDSSRSSANSKTARAIPLRTIPSNAQTATNHNSSGDFSELSEKAQKLEASLKRAQSFVLNWSSVFPFSQKSLTRFQEILTQHEWEVLLEKKDLESLMSLLKNFFHASLQNSSLKKSLDTMLNQFIVFYLEIHPQVSSSSSTFEALLSLKEKLAFLGTRLSTVGNYRVLEQNAVNEIHNHFADLMNTQAYENALSWIEEKIPFFPKNSLLLSDRSKAAKILASRSSSPSSTGTSR